uniref:G0/G1 switch 2 n=1 Tax=Esox lucius TaxID=8010 RepID=A0AAY5JWH6_ESOLU
MYEVIPFVKEMLSQKPSRAMLKLYLVGSVMALLGTVLGLIECFYQSFSYGDPLDAELASLIAREQRALEAEERKRAQDVAVFSASQQITIPKKLEFEATEAQRIAGSAIRLHAT